MEKAGVPCISAPWEDRRSVASLWFTSLLLMSGAVAHSESGRELMGRIVHSCAAYVFSLLSALGLASFFAAAPAAPQVVTAAPAPVQVKLHKSHLVASPPPVTAAVPLENDPAAHAFTYVFEGKGTCEGRPCANASVLVRLSTPRIDVYQGTITDADGNYSVSLKIQAAENEPVDFSVEAYNPDFQKIELSGRRIVMHEDTTITVQKPLDFIPG